ncbi:MAG: lysophospholipid acyltransferase family protein [bacterium]|nr:lysophospholipid acyltransferase family protein [bacterium]
METPVSLFTLKNTHQSNFRNRMADVGDSLLGLKALNYHYQKICRSVTPNRNFVQTALESLYVKFQANAQDIKRVPKTGSLLVVANHPFGMIEGLGLFNVLQQIRPDVKFLANQMLERVPETKDFCIYVDPFSSDSSIANNLSGIREAIRWLKEGGVLVVFPAGEVASWQTTTRKVTEPVWQTTVARLQRIAQAPVLPIYIDGKNSFSFHVAGILHPILRTALLPRQFLNKRNQTVRLAIGNVIPNRKLRTYSNDSQMMESLRERTLFLENRFTPNKRAPVFAKKLPRQTEIPEPITNDILALEIDRLPRERSLVSVREFDVFYAQANEIPYVLGEIGRLREVTFRMVGEGTGNSVDLDDFDQSYTHLFVWNREKQEIVGAYRLGLTDRILMESGKQGLYTATLFRFHPALFSQLSPALELGRSFVRVEYQRVSLALALLWRGIGAFVARNPRYKKLFGPVSISNDYHAVSHQVIVSFLKDNRLNPDLAGWVKSRNPFKAKPVKGLHHTSSREVLKDIEDVASFVADLEADNKGIPTLLREYLKLGGKLIGFNVDSDFSNVVDGLILVDLTETDPRILSRYMGKDETQIFLEYHGLAPTTTDDPIEPEAIPIPA